MLKFKNKKGFIMFFMAALVLVLMFGIGVSVYILTYREQKILRNITRSSQAYYTAEAGIEDSIYRLISGKNYEATNQLVVGQGLADISIYSEDGLQVIESTGTILQRVRKLKIILDLKTTTISFHYGAQVGKGGLEIQPNAKVHGNVYSNGSIQGSGLISEITGDAWVAGGVAPNPDQEWISQDSDFLFGIKSGSVYYLDTAQSFIPTESKVLNTVSLYLKKIGSPPDQTVRILTDDGGQPSQTSLASGTLKTSRVTSSYGWVDVSFDPPPDLTVSQTYWIVIDVSRDDDNYWVWGKDSADGYAFGTGKYTKDWSKGDAIWTEVGGDLNFKTWTGGLITFIDNTLVGVDAHANTITNSSIGQDAYYQYIESTTVGGTEYPGSPDPAIKDLPMSYGQIQEWEKGACCDTGAGCQPECIYSGNYAPSDGSSLGPLKIEGDLTFPANGTVTIEAPVWVTGKILAENNVAIRLKEGLSYGYPIIVDTGNPDDEVDYVQIEMNNNVITEDGSGGGFLLFISVNKRLNDSDPIVWLYNNVNKDLAQSIIFTLQGMIRVENNAKFKEISGYALQLANNAEIVYESGLIHSNFSSGPGGGWEIGDWKEIE